MADAERTIFGRSAPRLALGLCFLCALGACFSVPDRAAAQVGATAYTCQKGAGTQFTDSHCKSAESGEFAHVGFAQEQPTEITLSNITTGTERSPWLFEYVYLGVPFQLTAQTVQGSGVLTNLKSESGEHYVEPEFTLELSEVTVSKPVGKGCTVEGGKITTKTLKATTEKQEDLLQIVPQEGSVFAEIAIDGCVNGSWNGLYAVTGSFKLSVSGATATATHSSVTGENTYKVHGAKAGVSGSLTISGRELGGGEYTPLAIATGETPSEEEETAEAAKTKAEEEEKTVEEEEAETEEEAKTKEEEETSTPPATEGTTGFTCGPVSQPNALAGFSKSHCKAGDAVGTNAAFRHTEIAQGTSTEVLGSNKNTGEATESDLPMSFRATTSGIDTEIQAATVSATGTMENMKDATTGEHTVSGAITATFSGVTVSRPEGKGCKVKGEEFKSKELRVTSAGQGDAIKLEPASGTVLATFEIEGCSTEALNGPFEVKGSIKGTPEGATINFTEEGSTIQNTMTMRSVPAGIEGSLTMAGRVKESGSNYTDISLTTVKT